MIPWALTTENATGTHTAAADAAPDRTAAIAAAADAARAAVLTTTETEDPPRITITIDAEPELILGMSVDQLGKLDRDVALDLIDRFERDALTQPLDDPRTRNQPVGRGRAELGE